MPLRLTQLHQQLKEHDRGDGAADKDKVIVKHNKVDDLSILNQHGDGSQASPEIAIEAQTAFGKVTVTNLALNSVGRAFNNLITNASYQIIATKEKLGVQTLSSIQADELSRSGLLDGEQWHICPSQELQRFRDDRLAVSGSVTFSIAGIAAYPLLRESSAIRSLAILVAIAGLLGPVEDNIESIVDGILNIMVGNDLGLGRNYFATRLRRTLLAIHAGHRTNGLRHTFQTFVLGCLDQLPLEVRKQCATTVENVRAIGMTDSQLRSITEWAFSTEPRTLVLKDSVEVLATAVVSTCLRSCRIAVVDCHAGFCQSFNKQSQGPHAFAVYHNGEAQNAIQILHQNNWLQPYVVPPSERILSARAKLKFCCPVLMTFNFCVVFLQSVGIAESAANTIIECLKHDAIAHFSREIIIRADEEIGNSYTSRHNVRYHYEYDVPNPMGYDWTSWLGMAVSNLDRIIAHQPTTNIEMGNCWYEGYTAQYLNDEPSTRSKHKTEIDVQRGRNDYSVSSPTSHAISEVAGLIYALALSCVHIHNKIDSELSVTLGEGLGEAYTAVTSGSSSGSRRKLSRNVCLGILASLWLGLPGIWIQDWPQTSLGISNSQGSVISAIVADTESLKQATTKFVVATDVPDLMQADQPVVACSSTPMSTVQSFGHSAQDPLTLSKPYDGCINVHCLTVTGGRPPPLNSTRLHGSVIVVPVVGYVACGLHWFEYVDLDDAFAVMADSFVDKVRCIGPAPRCTKGLQADVAKARWLKAETMLQRDSSGKGFTCAQTAGGGDKLVVPALGSGLKQSFLCGVFRGTSQMLRVADLSCIEHTAGDVVIT